MEEFIEIKAVLSAFFFGTPRILAAFAILPFFSKAMLGGRLTRNGVAFSLSLLVLPLVMGQKAQADLTGFFAVFVIFKEIFIGLLLGFLATVPFWAVESVGLLIDNQRGASMASAMNPMSGSQASPLGIILVQVCVTLFFVGGSFLLFLGAVYNSFAVWPIFEMIPRIKLDNARFFLEQLDYIFSFMVLFAGPVVIAMFFAEFGLGLISRFAPQLNVFFLAMPVKSAVAVLVLIIYMQLLVGHFSTYMKFGDELITTLQTLI
ncbi:type III secretion system export apparatus subunit SctT [Thalassomonas sp. RHCl1]|uniref:type III secretion system export apparatus subunit SctT n=1 Tax=Thalassomonas sp. RHCl1 TaxID=2995320 RepID=UPI00248BF443|nr:type III secretion system export apparatus subunit SctT [Thalassomonas sp. RHCl1]